MASRPLAQRPAALFHLLARAGVMKQASAAICEVARMLIDRRGFDDELRDRLRDDVTLVYERPDGRGFPKGWGPPSSRCPPSACSPSSA